MNANSMVGNTQQILAKEYKPLCEDEIIINGMKSNIKYKKRKENIKAKNNLSLTRQGKA